MSAHNYRLVVLADLSGQRQLMTAYVEGVMAVTVEQLLKWALKNPDTVVDGSGVERFMDSSSVVFLQAVHQR